MRDASAHGLRGIASLNVVLSHYVAAFWPILLDGNYPGIAPPDAPSSLWSELLSTPLATLAFNGHFAVVVFFVLSGYVLAMPSFRGEYGSIDRRLFARYFRLNGPIAAVCLISWALLQSGLYWNHEAAEVAGSPWLATWFSEPASAFSLLQIGLYDGIMGNGALVPPLWSLRIEFIGSLILLASLSLTRSWVLGLCVAAILTKAFNPVDQVYLLSIIAGAALNGASLSRRPAFFAIGLGLFLGAYQAQSAVYAWAPFGKETANAIGAILLVAGVCCGGGVRLLASRRLTTLGDISFSLYLVHFLVLCSFSSWFVSEFGNSAGSLAVGLALYLLVTTAFSFVLYRIVDLPSVAISGSISRCIQKLAKQRLPGSAH